MILAVIFVLGIVAVIFALPSPAEVGKQLGLSKKSPALTSTKDEPLQETQRNLPSEIQEVPVPSAEESQNNEPSTLLSEYLLDPQTPLLNFCPYLENAKKRESETYNGHELGEAFAKNATSEDKDPVIESLLPFIRYTVRLSEVEKLIQQAMTAAEQNDESFMKKAEFLSQLVRVKAQLSQETPQLEKMMDQSYLFFMLSKVARLHPDLARDPSVLRYCEDMQTAFNDQPQLDLSSRRESFSEFLAENNISPQEIGYDPNYRTDLASDVGPDGIKIGGGWIGSLMKY